MSTNNARAWEAEYRDPKFLTLGTEPLSDIRDFVRWLRRRRQEDLSGFAVLDLGCGNGKNLNYVVGQFAHSGIGYDVSGTAIRSAAELAGRLAQGSVRYEVRSIGEAFPLGDGSVDLVFDATSSNSLAERERETCLSEMLRVLRSGGYVFVRALCKDGDDHAKRLIRDVPGPERDTYVLPGVGVTERVFTRGDFELLYGARFEILGLKRTSGYQRWEGRSYRRNYWVAYLRKR